MKQKIRSTIRDVARAAKVSVATVSRVINNPSQVRMDTRERVLKAMKKCNYVYNALAGSLSGKKTAILGVIVPAIHNPNFAITTKGIQDYAGKIGYSIILGDTDYEEANELKLIHFFQEKRVDGVILNGPWRKAPDFSHLKNTRLPFVITWQIVKDKEVSFVGIDNFKSAYRMVEYVISLGHSRIGMIAGRFAVSERAVMRWKGYRKCLLDKGIPYDPQLVVEKSYTFSDSKEAMAHLLDLPNPPTAVFCGNDILAIGAIVSVKERGLNVPRDISISGFNGMEISTYYDPPLTTMAVPAYEMGRLAAKILIENIRGECKTPQQYTLETNLIVRESTGKKEIP